MTDFSLQIIYDNVMYLMPGIIWILFTTFMIFLSMHLGKWHSDNMWKNNIKFHMPKVTKEEINSRDEIIKTLTEELETVKKENHELKAACTAMKNIADVIKPVKGVDITPDKKQPKLKKKG